MSVSPVSAETRLALSLVQEKARKWQKETQHKISIDRNVSEEFRQGYSNAIEDSLIAICFTIKQIIAGEC